MTRGPSEHPTTRDLDLILEKTRLRIEDLLWHHGCAPETETGLIRDAVAALTQRWSHVHVHDREQWLLDQVATNLRRATVF